MGTCDMIKLINPLIKEGPKTEKNEKEGEKYSKILAEKFQKVERDMDI
jgi:hypothetical protein